MALTPPLVPLLVPLLAVRERRTSKRGGQQPEQPSTVPQATAPQVIPSQGEASMRGPDVPGNAPATSPQEPTIPEPVAEQLGGKPPHSKPHSKRPTTPAKRGRPPGGQRSFWQRYSVLLTWLISLMVIGGVLAASWFLLPIRSVTVVGNHHLSETEVKRLAGLERAQPFGWLYYSPGQASALRDNAWVEAAHITRIFPDRVVLTINERQPVAWLRRSNGELTALAADATPLPSYQSEPSTAQTATTSTTPAADTPEPHMTGGVAGVDAKAPDTATSAQRPLPVISGWGPERSDDALYAAGALSRYNVKSVEYSPTGITVQTDKGTIWSGDRALFLKYAAAIESQSEGSRINLYPWGVSVQK